MSEWKRLTPEDHEQSVYVRYQHIIPAHWNREHHIQMMPLRNDVRLMNTEALAFAAQLPEVKALCEAAKGMRAFQLDDTAEFIALDAALRPFQEAA